MQSILLYTISMQHGIWPQHSPLTLSSPWSDMHPRRHHFGFQSGSVRGDTLESCPRLAAILHTHIIFLLHRVSSTAAWLHSSHLRALWVCFPPLTKSSGTVPRYLTQALTSKLTANAVQKLSHDILSNCDFKCREVNPESQL